MSRRGGRDSFFVKPKTANNSNSVANSTNSSHSNAAKPTKGKKRPRRDVALGKAKSKANFSAKEKFPRAPQQKSFSGVDDEIGSGDDDDDENDRLVNNNDGDDNDNDNFVASRAPSRQHAPDDDASTSENADEKRSRLARRYITHISETLHRDKVARRRRVGASGDDDDDGGGDDDDSSGDNVRGRVIAGQKDDEVDAMLAEARRRRLEDGEEDVGYDGAGDDASFEIETAVEGADNELAVRDLIDQQMTEDLLEQENKLVHAVARHTRVVDGGSLWLKGLKAPVTCVAATADFVFAGCKQGSIMQWCAKTGRRLHTYRGAVRAPVESGGHAGAVLCLAVSSDGKLMLSGGADCIVRLWDVDEKKLIDSFSGHREPITGVAFRRHTHQFYTTSVDRTVRVWEGDERLYIDTLFGHQAPVQALAAFAKERCVTVGTDRTLRVWKVLQESQLVFRGHKASIDCLAMLDDAWFVTGSQDGAVSLWNAARKRPHATVPRAHAVPVDAAERGNGGWVSACAALPLTDLVATGSCDGFVRLWRADRQSRRFGPASYVFAADAAKSSRKSKSAAGRTLTDVDENSDEAAANADAEANLLPSGRYQSALAESAIAAPGFVNGLCFAPDGTFVVAAVSREHRLGRWSTIKQARDGVLLTRLQLPIQLRSKPRPLFDGGADEPLENKEDDDESDVAASDKSNDGDENDDDADNDDNDDDKRRRRGRAGQAGNQRKQRRTNNKTVR